MEINDTLLLRTIKASRSVSLVSIAKLLIQFCTQLILVKKIAPEIFGIFAFAQMVVGFFSLFCSMQGQKIIIRERAKDGSIVDVVFTFELCIGVIISIFLVIFSPLISHILNKPEITRYMQVMVLTVISDLLITTPRAIFEKDMDFSKANVSTFIGVIVNAFTSIILVLLGFEIWSLILGVIIGNFVEALILWKMLPLRPKISFDKKILSKAVKFGLPLTLSGVVAFLYSNIDKFMVGKMMGNIQLGYYWFAFTIPHFLLAFQTNIGSVAFPAFTNAENTQQLKRGFEKATKLSAILFLLPTAVMFVLGNSAIRFIFGEKWLPALLPFQIFMLLIAIRGIVISHWSNIYMIKGKSIIVLYISIFYFILISSLGYLIIPKYGISGMAVVVLFTILCSIPISKFTLNSVIRYSYIKILWPQIIMFFIAILACFSMAVVASKSFTWFLGSLVLVIILYISSLYILDKEMFLWCKNIIKYLLKF